jgi:hypothetical protein
MSILKPFVGVTFDPTNADHLREFQHFLEKGRWKTTCPFSTDEDDLSAPHRIAFVVAKHHIDRKLQKPVVRPLKEGGLKAGEMFVIGGRAGVGKSALCKVK